MSCGTPIRLFAFCHAAIHAKELITDFGVRVIHGSMILKSLNIDSREGPAQVCEFLRESVRIIRNG